MRSDFSALDAQLDALGPPLALDVVALARNYAGVLEPLHAVDDALSALEAGLPSLPLASAQVESPRAPSSARSDAAPAAVPAPSAPQPVEAVREQIELPEPIREPASVSASAPLDSGAFAVRRDKPSYESAVTNVPRRRDDSRDITMDAIDEELMDAELEDILLTPEAAPLGNVPNALFDLTAPTNAKAEIEADAAFAALFAEATRQSSMPSELEPPDETVVFDSASLAMEPPDDTEVFNSASLSIDPSSISLSPGLPFEHALTEPAKGRQSAPADLELAFRDETLDSDEFEIVHDVVTDAQPDGSSAQRPSRPPEKRPSFLGRLFSRKDE